MAKKTSTRRRRSPEERIADYQKKIEEIKVRAAAKGLKESPAMKRTMTRRRWTVVLAVVVGSLILVLAALTATLLLLAVG